MEAKKRGFGQATLDGLEQEMVARYATERAKGSTAEKFTISAKAAEVYIRHHIMVRGLTSKADFRARRAGKADGRLYIDGHPFDYDVKTGGTVGSPKADGNWDEEDILPKVQYVIFTVMDIVEDEDDILDDSIIFTREAWLELCASCSRKGLKGTFHVTGKSPVIAFQPTPLNKLRRMVEDMLNAGEGWTVRDYQAT